MSRHRHHPPRPPRPRHPWRGLILKMNKQFPAVPLFRPANLPDEDDIFTPTLLDKLLDPDWIAANWNNPTLLGLTDPPDDID